MIHFSSEKNLIFLGEPCSSEPCRLFVQGIEDIWAMKKTGCLVYIGDYNTQFCGDFSKPL